MALSFDTYIGNVSADLTTAELIDATVYGGANTERADLALYVYLYKRSAALVDVAVTILNTSPTSAASWSFALAGAASDGGYRAIVFAFPIWTAGTYAANKCVYHSGVYYLANTSTTGTPGVSGDWDVITDILAEVLNLSNSGVEIGQINNFMTAYAEALPISNALQDLGPKIRNGQCNNINDAIQALWYQGMLNSAWMNFQRGDTVEAQQIVDFINATWAA